MLKLCGRSLDGSRGGIYETGCFCEILSVAIARQIIVEKHNGTLEVQSAIGQGTEFVIKILV
jgi:hypothetical protein